jgi:pimeloyl-ACP methyl ester carboxylesterase
MTGTSAPRVRRGYFDCRFGQLHVHNAIPSGGGFDEGTALLCVHGSPGSGRRFRPFLARMGGDRSVYAPDMPGCGESDPPADGASIADYAAALGDFLDSMRLRRIDVLGHQCGALVATELAIARPQQVRRVVLASVPVLTEAEREPFRSAHMPPSVDEGGRFLSAALLYPARERLPLIGQPLLVLRPPDDLSRATLRVRELRTTASMLDLPDGGADPFATPPDEMMKTLREFLAG